MKRERDREKGRESDDCWGRLFLEHADSAFFLSFPIYLSLTFSLSFSHNISSFLAVSCSRYISYNFYSFSHYLYFHFPFALSLGPYVYIGHGHLCWYIMTQPVETLLRRWAWRDGLVSLSLSLSLYLCVSLLIMAIYVGILWPTQ